ncbi:MAG: DUF4124 domain-containing protein [Burkholderiales bacterium]|nr:DUF4124 domain-containing protein [Burkholderiales bacterium]
MNRLLSGLFLFISVQACAHAQGEVYMCIDENGKKLYQNKGAGKGCKKMDLQDITVLPAPTPPAAGKKPQGKPASSPSDFPKVDDSTQKARDSDRKQILMDELKAEEQKLANIKKEYNNGEPERRGDERNFAKYQERTNLMKEDISRTEKNIEALKREIANAK